MSESLRIFKFKANNFKKLRAIEITPQGNIVPLTGMNEQGKTSILEAIKCAIGGLRGNAPAKPIREGEERADIHIDLGKYIVTRLFTHDEKQPPIVVRAKNEHGLPGRSLRSGQDVLDEMLGDLTFDPLAFTRMKPKEQYEELRRVVKIGPEIDQLDLDNQKDYEERTRWNRMAKEAKSAGESIEVPDDLPPERHNVAVLAEELEKATQHNERAEQEKIDRAALEVKLNDLMNRTKKIKENLPVQIKQIETRRDERIAELNRQIAQVASQANRDMFEAEQTAQRDIKLLVADQQKIGEHLATAQPIPEPLDTLRIKEDIANAELINRGIEARERRALKLAEADHHADFAKEITARMNRRDERKQEIIAAAKMPVPELGIQDGVVTYKGLPLEQASSAERLRVSVGIAMAANPTLRILLIEDGSLLDSKSFAIIQEMATERGYQCWIESVSETGDVGFVIEDGMVVADNEGDQS